MTKKILALALAGTTAFSVFASAMSVNAAVTALNADAYKPANFKIETTTGLDTSSYDGTIGLVTTAWSSIDLYEMRNDTSKSYWAYDFVVKSVDPGSMDDVENALAVEDYDELNTALAARYNATGTTLNFETASEISYYDSSSVRKSVIDEFNRVWKAASDFDTDLYDVADLAAYGLCKTEMSGADEVLATPAANWLIYDILNADVGNTATSQLLFYVQEYDRLLGSDGIVSTSTSYEDQYYTMLDEMDLVESDYTDANWKRIEAFLLDAEKDAAKDTEAGYKDAIADLNSAKGVKTITPDYATLKSSLEALFTDAKIPTVQPGTDAGDIPVYVGTTAGKCAYLEGDYKVNRRTSDEWYDFAGRIVGNVNHNDYVEGAYRKAMEVYANCRVSTRRAYVGQSVVDAAVAALEDALAAMDPNYDAANWKLAYLQEMVDKAQSLDENDYKTNSSVYKDFVKKLAAAETALNATTINPTNAETKAKALEEAMNKLNQAQKSVPAATKTEAKNLRKEANDLYKNVEGKTDAQIKALKDAIEAYDALDSTATISEYADVIDALNAAITNYSQAQGWYQNEAGQYMYGEGDGYYVDGWKKIGNFWFYFNADGTAKQNEWFQDGGNWYYCGNSCVAYSGWGKVDGSWYYFSKSNVMCTGWVRPANSYYYLDPTSGKMVTGWAQIGGKWYYFSTDANTLGAMLVSTTTPDGYQVGADGAMI